MASRGGLNGLALAEIAAGVILAWSGITNASLIATARSVAGGKKPKPDTGAEPIGGTSPAGTTAAAPAAGGQTGGIFGTVAGSATGAAIATDAQKYVGAGYVWGGAPAQGTGNWDCSSFVNWVVGHDLGMAIPGYKAGTYTGSSHGPPTGVWLLWTGAKPVSQAQAQPGDLIVWLTHMGIYLGGGQMISALDTAQGTQVTTIAGGSPTGEGPGSYRRL